MIQTKEQLPLLCYDTIFKSVFRNEENILGKMISDITGIDYALLKDNIVLETNELPVHKRNEKFKRCDFIIKVDDQMILNLELNSQSHTGLIVKNLSYVFQLFSTSFKKGGCYNEKFVVMQINLNCFRDSASKKELSKYYLKEEEDNRIYSNNLLIYDLNIVNCHEIYYNCGELKVPNYVRWGELLYCSDISKIPSITKGIMTCEERNRIMGILDKLTKDDLFLSKEDAMQWDEWERNTIYNDGVKEGIEQGIEKGIEQGIEKGIEQGIVKNTTEMIISMLKNNIDIETISKITNKSIKEIEMIKKQETL